MKCRSEVSSGESSPSARASHKVRKTRHDFPLRQAEAQARQLAADVKTLTGWLGQTCCHWPGRTSRSGASCSTSSSNSCACARRRPRIGSARCAWCCRVSATTCWTLRRCSTANSRPSRNSAASRVVPGAAGMPAAPQEANLDGLLAALERSARPPGPQVRGPRRRRARGMEGTPRSSSMLENLNSRLRRYFFLRRHLGNAYLSLLQFFLNHRVFMRSRRADRVGKMPKQLLTGPSPCALARAAGIRAISCRPDVRTDGRAAGPSQPVHDPCKTPRLAAPARSPVLPGNGRN
jgi:hypothetical protein